MTLPLLIQYMIVSMSLMSLLIILIVACQHISLRTAFAQPLLFLFGMGCYNLPVVDVEEHFPNSKLFEQEFDSIKREATSLLNNVDKIPSFASIDPEYKRNSED